MKTLILLFLISMNAHADQWFCTDEASVRGDDQVKTCGIGESKSEGCARLMAFDNARKEFMRVCNASSDCVGRYHYATPLRTECSKEDGGYKCYRMVEFRIGSPQRQTASNFKR